MSPHFSMFSPSYGGVRFMGNHYILEDAWTVHLRSALRKSIDDYGNPGKTMLSKEEKSFILSSAQRDLSRLIENIEHVTRDIARQGVKLTEMLEARGHMKSICDKLAKEDCSGCKDNEDDEE